MYQKPMGIKLPTASQADRKIAKSSKGHCTGRGVFGGDDGYLAEAESHGELNAQFMLNAQLNLNYFKEQALFSWKVNGQSKRHFFDALAFFTNGKRIAFTVKPEARVKSGRFMAEMEEIASHALAAGFCDEVRLVTENSINRIDLKNAMLFAAVRQRDPEAEAIAMAVTETLSGSASLQDLTVRTGMAARGYRALIGLVRKGHLIPSVHEIITPKTLLKIAEIAQ